MNNTEIIAKADEGYEGIFKAYGTKHLNTDEAIRYGSAKVSFAIVRCKDCKHWAPAFNTDVVFACHKKVLMQGEKNHTWFCADGERKDHD